MAHPPRANRRLPASRPAGVDRRRRAACGALLSLVLVAGATAGVDWYLRHGYAVTWKIPKTEKTPARRLARTVEHRVAFENEYRPLALYVREWPFEDRAIPPERPPFEATLEARLEIPEGPPRRFRVRSKNRARLRIDGGAADRQPPVPPGSHYVHAVWEGRLGAGSSFVLEWSDDGESYDPVPRTSLRPPQPRGDARRTLFVVAGLLGLALAAVVYGALRPEEPVRRRRRLGALAFLLILVAGSGLRLWDYRVMPEVHENPDELFALWNGWQLLEDGGTRGWSMWAWRYGDRVDVEELQYFKRETMYVISPYFEHPPLLHLLAGGAAHLGGAEQWTAVRLADGRLVPIALGMVSLLLVFALGRRLFERRSAAWLAALVYAVLPLTVITDRVIKEETLVVPLGLTSVLFFLRFRDGGERTRDLVVAAVAAGLCPWAKIPGIVFLASLVFLVLEMKRPRAATLAAVVGGAVVAGLLLYAAAIDWSLFWYTTEHQATGRPAHFNLFPRFFADPSINHNLVGQGWLLFLWLAFIATASRMPERNRSVFVIPPVVYMAAMGLASGNWTFGWYFLPLYPFLCLGGGALLAELWERPRLLGGFVFVGLLVLYGLNFVVDIEWAQTREAWPILRRTVTVILIVMLAPYALCHLASHELARRLARATTAVGLAIFVATSAYFVVRYDVLYDEARNFDTIRHFGR